MSHDAPVASICVDSPLPHLDRPFDYAVPERLREGVVVGTRVRVPLHGRLVSGIVVGLASEGSYSGRLLDIRSAAPLPSTTAAGIALAEAVARRYGGSLWDVVRLAVPPRVLAVEKRWLGRTPGPRREVASAAPALRPGERIVRESLPGASRRTVPAEDLAAAIVGARANGSVVVVLPDSRAIDSVVRALEEIGLRRWDARRAEGDVAVVRAESGPSERYDHYLAAMLGHASVVVGTRATVFQPVPVLAALVVWDEGNPVYLDPHAPYPHARTVAAMRVEGDESTESGGAALLLASWTPSVEAAALAEHGWARWETPSRDAVREAVPVVEVVTAGARVREGGRGRHWMPGSAWTSLLKGAQSGPVFVVVPRAGYVTAVACAACGAWAECRSCGASLALGGAGAVPTCGECGMVHEDWHCPACHGARLSQARQGVERIAEQLRRMAPGTPVAVSAATVGVLDDDAVSDGIVVATPGALPAVPGGYAAGAIVGADTGLGREGTEIDALRRWLGAAALVRSRTAGGRLVVVGDVAPDVRRALETWTPGELARDGVRERSRLGLPPHRRILRVAGPESLLARVAAIPVDRETLASHPEVTDVGGAPGTRTYLVPRGVASGVIEATRDIARDASRRGLGELRIRVDGSISLDA